MKTAHLVLCDVYGTLLEVGPGPVDAEARWQRLCHSFLKKSGGFEGGVDGQQAARKWPTTLEELDRAVQPLIAREHAAGRARGLAQPEVNWPALAGEVLPGLATLPEAERAAFFDQHARLVRTVRLMPGAAECLRAMRETGAVLGLVSNAQLATRGELAGALAAHGPGMDIFAPEWCFFSCEHGFAKPDPRVFALMAARAEAAGIGPGGILMIGDRADNDTAPALAAGWQAWLLRAGPADAREGGAAPASAAGAKTAASGDWAALLRAWRKAFSAHGLD